MPDAGRYASGWQTQAVVPFLGKLALVPATEAMHLLATPVLDSLRGDLLSQTYAAAIDPDVADTAELTEAYDLPLRVSANCVVVLGRRSGEQRAAGCVVLADSRVDVNNVVRRHLDVRKLSFAPQDWAMEQTGMEYGGITPVGLPADWPLLVDRRVHETNWVVLGSGIRRSKLALPGALLADLPNATVLDGVGA